MPREPIIVLTPNLTGRDGVSRLARLVVRAFDRVTVIALHEAAALTAFEHAEVRGADGGTARFVGQALRAAAAADAETIVVAVHLHLAPAALAFTTRGAALTTILCGVEAWKPLTWMQRAAIDRTERLVAISAHTRDRFRDANPAFAHRAVDVCHPGVDDTQLASGIRDARPTALIVGRMASDERYKGHDALLDVWAEVMRALPAATLRVVGDGDDRPRLEQKAAALGLNGRVVFLGRIGDETLAGEYERCAAFVMPSRDEGFGFVFVEAMRAGRACLASRGAAAEVVDDGVSGLVVDPADAGQLARSVVQLLRDRDAADRMGARGRARFLRDFTEARFRERFTALVDGAVPVLAK
ncbi:MAG TPA: glycosyltransferase family 4 protein [Vicinamibacterales bacterium]|nr:glycosyltransferase family 4 protein [Vicinamibacterales bacterium]